VIFMIVRGFVRCRCCQQRVLQNPCDFASWDYVQQEALAVPPQVDMLILLNFCDKKDSWSVKAPEVEEFIQSLQRTNVGSLQTCMPIGFGLRVIHTFFNLPFLRMQVRCRFVSLACSNDASFVRLLICRGCRMQL